MDLAAWELIGLAFVIVAGTLLHFAYGWSNKSAVVGIFSPVNESTWEHLKLLFFPMLIYSIFEYFSIGSGYPGFITTKSFGAALGLIVIIVLFYTYTGIMGRNYMIADILTFVAGVFIAYAYSWWAMKNDFGNELAGLLITAALIVMFVLYTFDPPRISLFLDPVTKSFGRNA